MLKNLKVKLAQNCLRQAISRSKDVQRIRRSASRDCSGNYSTCNDANKNIDKGGGKMVFGILSKSTKEVVCGGGAAR